MKKSIIIAAILGVANMALAITSITTTYGPIAGPKGVNWDGYYAYTWAVGAPALAADEVVIAATLSFNKINLTSGSGKLWVDFGTATASKSYVDFDIAGDYFDGRAGFNTVDVGVQTWTKSGSKTWSWDIADLAALNIRLHTGDLGFLFDPDCTFKVGSISFTYTTEKRGGGGGGGVPDGGMTAMLLGATLMGLGWAKRKISA